MQVRALLLLAAASFAAAAAIGPAAEDSIALPAELSKRACVKTGCNCASGTIPGIYCGSCLRPPVGNEAVVQPPSILNVHHVYQCGTGGSCCDYGYASDCLTSHAR
jgi:hypothetical protein